jgi:hypothetical protein
MIRLLARASADPVAQSFFRKLTIASSKYSFLCATFTVEDEQLLLRMEYPAFLETVYWSILRSYIMALRGAACERCRRQGMLSLHHRSYIHHGREHEHLDELEYLCRECHDAEHMPMAAAVEGLLRDLADGRASSAELPQAVTNAAYDPRTILNLHDYGDIRGRT